MKTIFNTTQNILASIKKQTSKNVRCFMILALATVLVSCNDNLEVDITPEGNDWAQVIYNTAECSYSGDILANGTAFFILDLFNSSNSDIGIFIMGFSTLPSSFANFKLDAGTYRFAENGAVRTLFPGTIADNGSKIGTFLYNFITNKFIFITEGSMTVALSGNTYTIVANFKGEDAATGKAVGNILVNYTGSIKYTDDSGMSPVRSTYTATGTPKWLSTPGDRTWTGTLEPIEEGNEKWYKISNWGNDDINIYLDDVDGKIVIDDYTRVTYTNTHNGYFRVAVIEGNNLILLDDRSEDYLVTYDPEAKKLTFPTKVTFMGKEYQALVGVAGYNTTTNSPEILFSDFYADVVFQLTPTTRSSVVRESNNIADKKMKLSGKTGFQKSSLNGLKIIESSQIISLQKRGESEKPNE